MDFSVAFALNSKYKREKIKLNYTSQYYSINKLCEGDDILSFKCSLCAPPLSRVEMSRKETCQNDV